MPRSTKRPGGKQASKRFRLTRVIRKTHRRKRGRTVRTLSGHVLQS